MSLYSKGVNIGAEDFGVTKYREIADGMGRTGSGVIAFRKNEATPDFFPFPSDEGATAKYDELANAPGDYVYLYLYRDGKPVDEGYFTATSQQTVKYETKTETRKERVGLGWILGGVGTALLGMSAFKKRK